MKNLKILLNGLLKENPTFVLLLGMCPTLATTTSAVNGLSMGLATTFVLICSNVAVSVIKKVTPDMVRIPVFVVLIASFVTVLQMALAAWMPSVNASLGLYIPLIVVNCIILERAESFASKNGCGKLVRRRWHGIRLYPWFDSSWHAARVSWYRYLVRSLYCARTIWRPRLHPSSWSVYRARISYCSRKQDEIVFSR